MRTKMACIVLLVLAQAIVGCGGTKSLQETATGDIPGWFQSLPQDPNYFFAASSGTSQDMQLALDKAVTSARAEIGRQVEVQVKSIQRKFDEEVGLGQNAELLQQFTQATKTVVSTSLSGSRVRHQKVTKDGNRWRGYALVEYPLGAANEALLQQIKSSRNMYTRFRASEAFKELEQEVDKYEAWKKQQGQW